MQSCNQSADAFSSKESSYRRNVIFYLIRRIVSLRGSPSVSLSDNSRCCHCPETNARSRFRFLAIYIHMESHPILTTTRDNSHATRRHSNVPERYFSKRQPTMDNPRISETTKTQTPERFLFFRAQIAYIRVSPDRGNLFFLRRPTTFSKTQMYEDDVHRQPITYLATYFHHFRVDRFEIISSEKSGFYLQKYPVKSSGSNQTKTVEVKKVSRII